MNMILGLSLVLSLSCFSLSAHEEKAYEVIPDQAKVSILTPTFSQRAVSKIRLNNGLEAYLVSDPKADKSGAILSVKVGSWQDPPEYPGLAHFLEHMLFLGTKKYPEESAYHRFISENSGQANAFTTFNQTGFLFSIDHAAFKNALDRFASFFKEPLFNPSGVSRERQAVNQEHAKNIENDGTRLFHVDKMLANPGHPYHQFATGNIDTLSGVTREILKDWYERYYSADRMRLIVTSSMPMGELTALVVDTFKDIPNRGTSLTLPQAPLFLNSGYGQMVYVEPIKNSYSLALIWDVPKEVIAHPEGHPVDLVCETLGDHGENSLFAQLQREGLAENVMSCPLRMNEDSMSLYLDVDLTSKGLTQVQTVLDRIFQTIAMIKQEGIPSYLFDEDRQMSLVNYQYQTRGDLFGEMMKNYSMILYEPLATYPEQQLIPQKYDPVQIQNLVDSLTPRHTRIYVVAPSALTGLNYTLQEPWVGVNYTVQPIPEAQLHQWETLGEHSGIHFAPPNPFIPKNLTLVTQHRSAESSTHLPHPELVFDSDKGKIYFAQDDRFQLPQVSWNLEIKTPAIDMGKPGKIVQADLYLKALNDTLTRMGHAAEVAGLSYDVRRTDFGIHIAIVGFSENAPLLLADILSQFHQVNPTEQQFEDYKESLRRDYQNFAKEMPFLQASEWLKTSLYDPFTNQQQKATALQRVTLEKFQNYKEHLFDKIYFEGVLYGNMQAKDAKAVIQSLEKTFPGKSFTKENQRRQIVRLLPAVEGPFALEVKSKAQGNVTLLAIQHSTFNPKERAMQQILMQAIKEPFFSTLRTQQQTGYLVRSDGLEVQKQLVNIFAVQSSTHGSRDLLARFDLFLESFLQELNRELPQERFETLKQRNIDNLLLPPKNMTEMGDILFRLAFEYEGDFDWITKRIEAMRALTYEEFKPKVSEILGKQNRRRLAILLSGADPDQQGWYYAAFQNLSQMQKKFEIADSKK